MLHNVTPKGAPGGGGDPASRTGLAATTLRALPHAEAVTTRHGLRALPAGDARGPFRRQPPVVRRCAAGVRLGMRGAEGAPPVICAVPVGGRRAIAILRVSRDPRTSASGHFRVRPTTTQRWAGTPVARVRRAIASAQRGAGTPVARLRRAIASEWSKSGGEPRPSPAALV